MSRFLTSPDVLSTYIYHLVHYSSALALSLSLALPQGSHCLCFCLLSPKVYASVSFLLGNLNAWALLWPNRCSSSDRNSSFASPWSYESTPSTARPHTRPLWLLSQSWQVCLCLTSWQISPKGITDLVSLYQLWLSFEGERPEQFLGKYCTLKAYKNVNKVGWWSYWCHFKKCPRAISRLWNSYFFTIGLVFPLASFLWPCSKSIWEFVPGRRVKWQSHGFSVCPGTWQHKPSKPFPAGSLGNLEIV